MFEVFIYKLIFISYVYFSYGQLQESINYDVEYELVEDLKYIAIGGICLGKRSGTFEYKHFNFYIILFVIYN